MSRYSLGKFSCNKSVLSVIEEGVKESIFKEIPKNGNWLVYYGYDRMAVGYFIQFKNIDEPENDGKEPEYINLDYMFDGLTGLELGHIMRCICVPCDTTIFHHSATAMLDGAF